MGFLTGGSKQSSKSSSSSQQQSSSSNQAYPYLQQQLGSTISGSGKANLALENLLGLNGQGAFDEGFQNYKDSAGYNFMMNEGQRAITSNKAAKGLLGSGSFGKALLKYGQGVGNQYFNQYLDRLLGMSGQGLQGAGILAGAGNVSNSSGTSVSESTGTSSSNPGIAGLIGAGASIFAKGGG